jgi:hypothetical protein
MMINREEAAQIRTGGPTLSLVVPTYNESGNIGPLVRRIADALDRVGITFDIVVVDDDSPDRTWQTAQELAAREPRLRVIRRQTERGLASAVVAAGARQRESDKVIGISFERPATENSRLPRRPSVRVREPKACLRERASKRQSEKADRPRIPNLEGTISNKMLSCQLHR